MVNTRLQTQSYPECEDGCESDGGEEVAAEFVVSCCDAPEVLDAAKGVFDQMPVPVAPFVVMDFAFPVRAAGDDGDGSPAAQGRAQGIGIIPLIGDQWHTRQGDRGRRTDDQEAR